MNINFVKAEVSIRGGDILTAPEGDLFVCVYNGSEFIICRCFDGQFICRLSEASTYKFENITCRATLVIAG